MATHAEAAKTAALIFVCVHREHYEFLESLAPHLHGKVDVDPPTFSRFNILLQTRARETAALQWRSGDVSAIGSQPVSDIPVQL